MNSVVPNLPVPVAALLAAVDYHLIASITDASGAIVYANSKFCEISGYTFPELLGQNHRLIKSAVHSEAFFTSLWETISSGKVWDGEVCNRAKNGSHYWVKSTVFPVLDDQGLPNFYISVRTDITQEKESAAQVQVLANELNELFRIAPIGIARLENRQFDKVNHLFAEMLGYQPEELLGTSTRKIYASDEQFVQLGRDAYKPVRDGRLFQGETALRKKDGSDIWAMIGVCSLTPDDPMHNTLYVIQDITEHRNLERRLEAALARSEMAQQAKQTFINNMSHQMYTPLNGILGVLQIFAMDELSAEQKTLTDEGLEAANHLLHMLDHSLEFAGLDQNTSFAQGESNTVQACLELLTYSVLNVAREQGVSVLSEVPETVAGVTFSTNQKKFCQLLSLVVDNAIRYNRPQGTVTLSVAVQAANRLVFSIADTGLGMSDEQIAQLGEPFVRYCETERIAGSGLGLAIAYRLAPMLGAEISVSSVQGEGTVFRITLNAD